MHLPILSIYGSTVLTTKCQEIWKISLAPLSRVQGNIFSFFILSNQKQKTPDILFIMIKDKDKHIFYILKAATTNFFLACLLYLRR